MFENQVNEKEFEEGRMQMIEKENVDINLPELILKSKDNEAKNFTAPYYEKNEEWVREYIEQFGEEPSFF